PVGTGLALGQLDPGDGLHQLLVAQPGAVAAQGRGQLGVEQGAGSAPQAWRNATRSSLGLCMIFSTAVSCSSPASASCMPGASGSTSRMSSSPGPSATCTSASCGQ